MEEFYQGQEEIVRQLLRKAEDELYETAEREARGNKKEGVGMMMMHDNVLRHCRDRGYDPRYGAPKINYSEWTSVFPFLRVVGKTPPYRSTKLKEELECFPEEEWTNSEDNSHTVDNI